MDSKLILAKNVDALMRKHYGGVNVTKLGRDTKIGTGGAQRILSGRENVGPDVIDRVAGHFGFEAWMLLSPDFDPASKPIPLLRLIEISQELRQLIGDLPAPETQIDSGARPKKGGSKRASG